MGGSSKIKKYYWLSRTFYIRDPHKNLYINIRKSWVFLINLMLLEDLGLRTIKSRFKAVSSATTIMVVRNGYHMLRFYDI